MAPRFNNRPIIENPNRPICSFPSCDLHGQPMVGSEGNPHPVAMLVGEAPGQEESESGYPFVGKSGRELTMYLRDFTRIPRRRFYITNLIRCRPPNNRDPNKTEIETCAAHLLLELSDIDPRIVGTIGRLSTQWFLGSDTKMEKVHGNVFEVDGRVIVPLYHPAFGLHSPRRMKEIIDDFRVLGEVVRGERGVTKTSDVVPQYTVRALS